MFGTLFGERSVVLGWLVHLVTSVVFGLVFAAWVSDPLVHELADSLGGLVLLGVMHATVLATASIGVVLPLVNLEFGDPGGATAAFPGATFGSFAELVVFGVGHLVYGVVLGTVYGWLRDRPG